jgi:hypothetical protein
MPQFNILKNVFRSKRDKAHRAPSGPTSSGQHTPDTIRGSVDSGVGGQPTREGATIGLVGPHINRQDDLDVIVHTNADSRLGGEPTPEVPIVLLDIASSISRATDIRDPLNFTSEALMKVLDTAKVSTFSIQLSPFGAENRIEYRFVERRLGFAPQEASVPP